MENNLISTIRDFINNEKMDLSISEDNNSEFWIDNLNGSITVRFNINVPDHKILYDVYSPEFSVHLKEETIKDVEDLEFLAEENRRWRIAETIEDIWLILDQTRIWAEINNFSIMEKRLV